MIIFIRELTIVYDNEEEDLDIKQDKMAIKKLG